MNHGVLPALGHVKPTQLAGGGKQGKEAHPSWSPVVRLAAWHSFPHGWHHRGCKADQSHATASRLGEMGTGSSQPPGSTHPCLPRAARLRYPSRGNGPGCAATGSPAQQVPHPNFPAELQQQMLEGRAGTTVPSRLSQGIPPNICWGVMTNARLIK